MTLDALIDAALAEDIGLGDVTTTTTVDPTLRGEAVILAKQELRLSGLEVASRVFERFGVSLAPRLCDGDQASPGVVVATLEGPLAGILTGERTALNFLMRLSGIATHTATVVAAAAGRVKVVDTRKTTPLHRALEKAAVRHGGGHNHRFGLFDGVLIKDNHIVAAGGLSAAVQRARANAHHLLKVEVEVETLEQLHEALAVGADVVLLDNMDDSTLAEAVRINAGRALLEASGNMDAARITRIRDLGLDFISVGGLIHQARWVDLSLRISDNA